MPDVAPHTLVDGRYEVLSRVGSGGMADVWCADDRQLGRRVALKLLHRRFSADAEFVERFRREASSAAGLQHGNVVQVYDRGEWDGAPYIAMEFLDGRTLKQVVREDGPLPPHRAIDLTLQMLRAARFAHRRGVIHRDLKPHNAIVDAEGRLKVTDFGIARAGASDMTETGSILGTAQYLSPEQAQGHAVSAASDLYSIGIVLFELLTGRVPFDGDQPVTIALKQVNEPPPPPSAVNPAVPPVLDAVVLRALEKDPARRFGDADAFIAALEHARAQLALPPGEQTASFAAPLPPGEETVIAAAERRDRRAWPWVLLGLALLGVAILLFALERGGGEERRPVPDVVRTQLEDARVILRNEGFLDVEVERVQSDQREDRVLRQDPQPGEEVPTDETITLTVSGGPGQTAVPNVEGQTVTAARRVLRRDDLEVGSVTREFSERVPEGRIITQNPSPGERVERGTAVTLVVSRGVERVEVPDVVGREREEAEATLEGDGLVPVVREQETDGEEPGTVLAQDPDGGTEVERGARVTITVATEPEDAVVPSTVGATQEEAIDALQRAGFDVNVETVTVEAEDEDGVVQRQSPSGGRRERGSEVTIFVGDFEETATTPDDGTDTPPDDPAGRAPDDETAARDEGAGA